MSKSQSAIDDLIISHKIEQLWIPVVVAIPIVASLFSWKLFQRRAKMMARIDNWNRLCLCNLSLSHSININNLLVLGLRENLKERLSGLELSTKSVHVNSSVQPI